MKGEIEGERGRNIIERCMDQGKSGRKEERRGGG